MQIKTISLFIILFLLASSASLGFVTLSGIQTASADKNILSDSFNNIWEYLPFSLPPIQSPNENINENGYHQIEWSEVSDATRYRLEKENNLSFTSPTIRNTGNAFQTSESVIVINAPPEAPVLDPISNPDGNGNYQVNWNAVADATSYTLEEDDNIAFNSPETKYSGGNIQVNINGQPAGRWYYHVLASNDAAESSPWSNIVSVDVIPDPPLLNTISNPEGDGIYSVDWTDELYATGYQLQEDDTAAFSSPTIYNINTPTSQYDISGQVGGTWYYRVRTNSSGVYSVWSNTQSVYVIPAAPVLSAISNPDGNGAYLVDWSDAIGATSYELQEDDNLTFTTPTTRYTGALSEYSVTGQLAGTWYYRARASNGGGASPWSNTQSVTVIPVPAAPVLSAISNPDLNGDYLVDWNDVPTATGYELQEDDNLTFTTPTTRYTGALSEYSVTGQVAGAWYYRVRASNGTGPSPWSNTQSVSVVPIAPVLSAISNPDGNGDYLVDWSDAVGATGYELQEDDTAAFSSPTTPYTGVISQYSVTGHVTGTFYYRVRANSLGGFSAWSNTQSVIVLPVPAAPVLSAISNPDLNGDYLVDWNDVPTATSYELQEDDNLTFTTPTTRYTGPISQFSITGQLVGTWYYRVRASNGSGISPWSNTQSVSVVPIAPILSPISNPDGNGDYLVDWSDAVGATGYELQEDDNLTFTTPTTRYTGVNSQYSVTGQVGGTFYYRVRANSLGGFSLWSNTQSVNVISNAPVLSPISNPDLNGDYLVDWSDMVGATSYELQEDDNLTFTTPTTRYTGSISQFSITGQPVGTWYYRVRASNAGGPSPWSNTQSVSVVPIAPILSPISNPDGNGDYLVDWSDAVGATSYELQEDETAAFSSPTTPYIGINSQYSVTSQVGGTWYYRVRANSLGGLSAWSNTQSVSVISNAPGLSPISNPDLNGDYLVDWSDVVGATGFELQEDDNLTFTTPSPRYSGSASQFSITGQPVGTWYYRVRANSSGGYSPWSNTESVVVINRIFLPLVVMYKPGVHVLPVSYNYSSSSAMYVIGEVINNTQDSITWVKVVVNFYNASHVLVATNNAYLKPRDLPAWEKGCFSISMDIPPSWSYYTFDSPTYSVSATSLGLKIINHSGSYNSTTKDYNIIGQVRNDGNQRSNSVGVSGTVYNSSGVPVGCNYGAVNSTDLEPGQISSFDIKYLSYYRDYIDVTNYKLRVAGDLP